AGLLGSNNAQHQVRGLTNHLDLSQKPYKSSATVHLSALVYINNQKEYGNSERCDKFAEVQCSFFVFTSSQYQALMLQECQMSQPIQNTAAARLHQGIQISSPSELQD